jgi:iron complex transport system permease protein
MTRLLRWSGSTLSWHLIVSLGALFVMMTISLALGSVALTPARFLTALTMPDADPVAAAIVFNIRLPRVLLACCAGALTAMAALLLAPPDRGAAPDPGWSGMMPLGALGAVIALTVSSWKPMVECDGSAGRVRRRCRIVCCNAALAAAPGHRLRRGACCTGMRIWVAGRRGAGCHLGALVSWQPGAARLAGLEHCLARSADRRVAGGRGGVSFHQTHRWRRYVGATVATAAATVAAGALGWIGSTAARRAQASDGSPVRRIVLAGLWGALLVVGIDLAARGATALLPSPGLIGELPLGALLVIISGAAYVHDRVRSRSHRA